MPMIHSSAHVDPHAQLADDVVVGPGAVIEDGVTVGRGCQLGPHAVLHRGTTLGADVYVAVGAALGGLPQDLKFTGGDSGVFVGDRTKVREYVTVHRCVAPGAVTRVGADCLLMATSHVAHECILGDHVMLANGVVMAGHVTIGDGTFVSGNVQIHQFTRLGRLALIGGGSKVLRDVLPFCVADGHPARLFGVNLVGLRRAGFDSTQIRAIREVYRVLFTSKLKVHAALDRLDELESNGNAVSAELAAFVRGSERGLMRPDRRSKTGGRQAEE